MAPAAAAALNNPLLLEHRPVDAPASPDGQAVELERFATLEAGVTAAVIALRGAIVSGLDTPGRLCAAFSGRCGVSSYGFSTYVAMRTRFPSVMRLDPGVASHLALIVRAMSEWLSGIELDPVLVARCVDSVLNPRCGT